VEIKLSKHIGYCKGVARVVRLAEKVMSMAASEGKKAYCIGSLVHNDRIRMGFEMRGMEFIKTPEGHEKGIALISAHGIPESLERSFREAGFTIVDGTCNNIIINKQQILKRAQMGCCVVIIGIPGHSETLCLQGVELFPGVPVTSVLVSKPEDLNLIPLGFPIFVIGQTTFKKDEFLNLVSLIQSKFNNVVVQKSLCPSPLARQQQILSLCRSCDAVLVVGGVQSANTAALADLSSSQGVKTFRLEHPDEIPEEVFSCSCVGVAAGSSTPAEEVDAIVKVLESHV